MPDDAHTAGLSCPAVQAEAAAEGEMVEYMSSEEMKRYRLQELERERQDKVGATVDVTRMQRARCGPVLPASAHPPQTSDREHQDRVGTAPVFRDPWPASIISNVSQSACCRTQRHCLGTTCCLDKESCDSSGRDGGSHSIVVGIADSCKLDPRLMQSVLADATLVLWLGGQSGALCSRWRRQGRTASSTRTCMHSLAHTVLYFHSNCQHCSACCCSHTSHPAAATPMALLSRPPVTTPSAPPAAGQAAAWGTLLALP